MKKLFLPILTLFVAIPAIVHADEVQRFEHEGRIYRYTITADGAHRVIRGVEERSGKPFTLRVGTHKVRGTVGSQQVEFSLRDVKPLTKPATAIAAR